MRGIPRLPDASLARLLVLRALVLWVFLHCMALALVTATTLERPDAAALRLGGRASLLVVALTAWLAYLDANRRNEVFFMQNLGVPRWVVVLLAAVPAACAEAIAIAISARAA